MLSLLVRRSSFISRNYVFKHHRQFSVLYSLVQQQYQSFPTPVRKCSILASDLSANSLQRLEISSGFFAANNRQLFGSQSQASAEPSTSDGLTVEDIVAANWTILDEDESDWKSHASAIAQSIHLIKKRLKVYFVYIYISDLPFEYSLEVILFPCLFPLFFCQKDQFLGLCCPHWGPVYMYQC